MQFCTKISFVFNGEVKDVSGFIYLRARHYNPKIGQFVQIDSYTGEDESIVSQNRYCYTMNNSYKYVDSSGYFSIFSAICGTTITLIKTIGSVINKKAKKEQLKLFSKKKEPIIKKAVKNNNLGILVRKPYENTLKRDYIRDIVNKKIKDPDTYIKKY